MTDLQRTRAKFLLAKREYLAEVRKAEALLMRRPSSEQRAFFTELAKLEQQAYLPAFLRRQAE